MNIPTHETPSLPDLTPEQYALALTETLRSLGDLGAYFIRVDENDGAIIIRQWSVIQSACGGTVPNTMAPEQRPTQKRLDRVTHLLAHVNRALQIGKPLIVRAEARESVCHSAVPTDQ